jgi:Tol biopolymer transport system component
LSALHVVSAHGGPSRSLGINVTPFAEQVPPVWSPDGRHLLVFGDPSGGSIPSVDWWLVPLDAQGPGDLVPTGAWAVFEKHNLYTKDTTPRPSDWIDNRIVFSASVGDTTNLWEVAISPSFRIGTPRRLTYSTEKQTSPRWASARSLVFATRERDTEIYEVDLESQGGTPRSTPRPITRYDWAHGLFTVSDDGRLLAFISERLGNAEVWLHDLETSVERPLTAPPGRKTFPVMTGDGTRVLYHATDGPTEALYVTSTSQGVPEKVCENCGFATGWSPDQRFVLLQQAWTAQGRVALLDLSSGRMSSILESPEHSLYRGHFSPDGRWIVFHAATHSGVYQEFLVPFRGEDPIPPSEWIAITDKTSLTDQPRLSPDGHLAYYVTDRDGFRCIWAQRLDKSSRRPIGSPSAVLHFHSRRRSMAELELRTDLAITRDKLFFDLGEARGNIWAAELLQ